MTRICALMFVLMLVGVGSEAQEMHDHPAPEKLGRVSFPITCASTVQAEFNRGVALLHSFAYGPAREAFQKVASDDPSCAIAHWGVAMAGFHQLWEPALPAATMALAQQEIGAAERLGSGSARERSYIHALSVLLTDVEPTSFAAHNLRYEQAMADLAAGNKQDVEAQVFYALALLSNASPADKTHARQKRALAILEPLAQAYPDHPGMTHYIIHACDSTELARRGETAARAYRRYSSRCAACVAHAVAHLYAAGAVG